MISKLDRVAYYVANIARQMVPAACFRRTRRTLTANISDHDRSRINQRVDYYLQHRKPFSISENAIAIKDFRLKGHPSMYFYDLKEYLNYFDRDLKVDFLFGDVIRVPPHATLVKSRPISPENANSVLFKLDKLRHFQFIRDPLNFTEKIDKLVWRGANYRPHRQAFLERFWNHPLCNVGQTNATDDAVPWRKEFMSVHDQLRYKFILCIEGNDVATNLKWAMSSNSLCLMVKPRYETWFMEGTLESGKHYVELKEDYSDLTERIEHYSTRPDEAAAIIASAHTHVAQFQDRELEQLIALSVLEKYFTLSGQQEKQP